MNLGKYRHLIWDWNGTLLDDAWLCREIMNRQLTRRGLPILTAERYEAVFDFPVEGYYRKVGFDWRNETFEEAGTEFILEYEKRKKECRLQPGAKELLHQIKKTGKSQAVLSAYSHKTLDEFLYITIMNNISFCGLQESLSLPDVIRDMVSSYAQV